MPAPMAGLSTASEALCAAIHETVTGLAGGPRFMTVRRAPIAPVPDPAVQGCLPKGAAGIRPLPLEGNCRGRPHGGLWR